MFPSPIFPIALDSTEGGSGYPTNLVITKALGLNQTVISVGSFPLPFHIQGGGTLVKNCKGPHETPQVGGALADFSMSPHETVQVGGALVDSSVSPAKTEQKGATLRMYAESTHQALQVKGTDDSVFFNQRGNTEKGEEHDAQGGTKGGGSGANQSSNQRTSKRGKGQRSRGMSNKYNADEFKKGVYS